ncbi:hypothetical protein GS682_04700 [Nostoc sp. B(2019)]|nr:hypothetical protein [Nostoc sp. B(2019)]
MASTIVDLIIRARDGTKDVLGRIRSTLGGLGNDGKKTGESMGDALFGAIVKANLLGQALSMVGNAASFMGQKFEEAKKIEIGDVSAASTFSALTKQSFADSTKFVSEFSKEIAVIAGTLPGATKDYNMVANSIMDNVIPAFKDANGVLDQGKFKENLVDITKKMTLMGVNSGTHAQAVGMFTARLLDGNIASAKQLLFADNNPAFMGQFKEALQKQGKTEADFKKMTSKQRLEIIQAVSEQFISKDVIEAASNTVEGLLAGIESSIFDPKSGVFGLLRDLSSAEGNQTVMSAVAGGIKAVTGFFEAGAKILQALGVPSVDPMMVLYNGINTFTGWVNQVAKFASQTAAIIRITKGEGGGFKSIVAMAQRFLSPKKLMAGLEGLLGQAAGFTNLIDPTRIMAGLDYFLKEAMTWINSLFSSLASSTGKLLSAGGGALGFATMGAKLGWFAGDMVAKLVYFVLNLPWGDIFITIGNLALAILPAISSAYVAFRARMVVLLGEVVVALGKGLMDGLNMIWIASTYTLQEAFGSIGSQINNAISYQINGWGEVFNYAISSTGNFFGQLGSAIADMWNRLMAAIKGAIDGVINSAGNFISNPLGSTGNFIGDAASSAFNAGSNVVSGAASFLGFYKGHIPTASGGLLGAFATESRNMPSGASPVMANDSEFILTPAQMSRLMRGSAAVGASSGGNVLAPVINVYGVNDPVAIARLALEQLEIMYTQQQQGQLA